VILATVRHYLPGDKSGGPVRSLSNMVAALGDEFDFRILTNDRDDGDTAPYPEVALDEWSRVGKAWVYYLSPSRRTLSNLRRLLSRTPHDLLYLNSFFHPWFSQWPLWMQRLGLLPRTPIILAPRGEMSPGALTLGRWKKWSYLRLTRAAGLYDRVLWHASSDFEAAEIRAAMGTRSAALAGRITVASDIPTAFSQRPAESLRARADGEPLRVVFLSRITPKKNLDFALDVLARVRTPVTFSIYGPFNETWYWRRCTALIERLPPHVTARYEGTVAHEDVALVMAAHDLLFLPTLGENYGHVIIEALMAGTPVLIADTTPWRGLEAAGVGWDLPLADPQAFADRIEAMWGLTAEAAGRLRDRAHRYGAAHQHDPRVLSDTKDLFGARSCAG
jgi:glycosyltransferase involved in cell wall biosynthesis